MSLYGRSGGLVSRKGCNEHSEVLRIGPILPEAEAKPRVHRDKAEETKKGLHHISTYVQPQPRCYRETGRRQRRNAGL